MAPLYPTHVPLAAWQKGVLTVLAGVGALMNPARGDLVAAFGEVTGKSAARNMRERMLRSTEGRSILHDKPRVTNEVLSAAAALPLGTFGRSYADFMRARGFEADDRPPVRFVDDVELAYVLTRYREVHDMWHVLFGCHTNILGEISLKAVEYVQTGLPMAALAAVGAQYRLKPRVRAALHRFFLPWALRASSSSRDLMCIYYERHFPEPLDVVRKHWNIEPAPDVPENRLAKHVTLPHTL